MREQSADTLCRRLEHDIEPMQKALRLAQWDAETTGAPEAFAEVESQRRTLMRRLSHRDDYALVGQLRDAPGLDARTRRELFRWRNAMAPHQVDEETIDKLAKDEAALVQQYNSFRARVNGRIVGDNEIDRILAESTDGGEVEEAWHASKTISDHRTADSGLSVTERLIDLVKLRNHAARQVCAFRKIWPHCSGNSGHLAGDVAVEDSPLCGEGFIALLPARRVEGQAASRDRDRLLFGLAPGSALGSLPSVALSSAQAIVDLILHRLARHPILLSAF